MSQKETGGLFRAAFTYTDGVLSDFEALYRQKKEVTPAMRIALGLPGAAGAVYFGLQLYRDGFQLARVGYLVIASIMLVLALSGGGRRPDDSAAKYRKYYLDKRAEFTFGDEAVEMRLEGQKRYARSKFREIYGLIDTDRCLYLQIKGRAYYILPKDSVEGGSAEDLMKYLQKKSGRKFQHFDVEVKSGPDRG